MADLIAIAQAYRATMQPELQAKGVVVINTAGEACGWVNELRNPESWEPGCVAVDADGNRWVATCGNAYDGAEEWVAEQYTEEQAEVEAPAISSSKILSLCLRQGVSKNESAFVFQN